MGKQARLKRERKNGLVFSRGRFSRIHPKAMAGIRQDLSLVSRSPKYITELRDLMGERTDVFLDTCSKLATGQYVSIYLQEPSVVDFLLLSTVRPKDVDAARTIAVDALNRHGAMVIHVIDEPNSLVLSRGAAGVNVEMHWANETFAPVPVGSDSELNKTGSENSLEQECNWQQRSAWIESKPLSDAEVEVHFNEAKAGRLAVNALLYMDAFPECVIDGPPSFDKPITEPKAITIKASAAIRETYRNGITPHMRRGHFRFLQNERYTGKRFQTVYVKPAMVKGHAKTVVEPA